MSYNNILLDFDGTLFDTGEGVMNSIIYTLDKFGMKVDDRKSLNRFMGPPLGDSFQRFCGFSKEDADKAVNIYREYYDTKGIFEIKLYDGMEEMLRALKDQGKVITTATSKGEPYAIQILKRYNLDKYFDYIAGSRMDGTRSKKSEVVEYALESIGNPPHNECVLIGDREYDVIGAKEVGIDCIGILHGYGSREELEKAGATFIAKDTVEAMSIINDK